MPVKKRSKIFETAQASLQAGRLEGIIDAPKSGRWGKWKYGMRGKTQYCQRYVKPRYPGTAAQVQAQDAFGRPAQAWGKKLTQEQREAWNAVAKHVWSEPRLDQAGHLHGEQVFTGRSSVLLKVGKEMLLWPTPRPVFGPNPVVGLSGSNGRDGVRIKLRVSGPVEEDVMVSGQAPCSAGRKKWRRGVYLCLLAAAEGGQTDITAEYVARFGEPEPGMKVFIRVQQQRDGWQDLPTDLSEVVPVNTEAGGLEREVGAGVGPLNELNALKEPSKLADDNSIGGLDGLPKARVDRQGGGGKGVRCTRE
jgi:hypothetical protein